jgi:hypothetical protein
VLRLLAQVWAASGSLGARRLKAALPTWRPWRRRHARTTPTLEAHRVRSRPRQIARRLRDRTRRIKRRLYGTTRPGALVKHLIPITTDHWDGRRPGALAIDLVSHAGASAAGECRHTLDGVDMQTGWVERQAGRGNGQHGILQALTPIAGPLPFALRGLDADNGSEGINDPVWAFGTQRPAGQVGPVTRARPSMQDDQAHIAQTHWTHGRTLVGWDRYERADALQALTALYAAVRIVQHLVPPSRQLLRKGRQGARLIRRYDTPQTPFARGRAGPAAEPQKITAIERLVARTDPCALSQRIDAHLERLGQLATRAPRLPRATTPGRGWTVSPAAQPQKQAMRRLERPHGGCARMARAESAAPRATAEAGFPGGSPKRPKARRGGRVAR